MRRTVRLAMLGILLVGVLGLSQGTTEALEAKLDTLDATLHGLHFFTDPSGKEIQWFPYISDQVKSLSEDLDLFEIKVIADLADLELAADAIEGKLDTLEGKADNLATQLSAHDSDMKAQFDQVDAALASLEGKADSLATQLGTHDSEVKARFDALDSAVAAVEGKLDEEDNFLDDAEFQDFWDTVWSTVTANDIMTNIDAVESQAQANYTQLTHPIWGLSILDSEIDAIEGKVDSLSTAVAAVEAKLDDETRFTDDAELATHEAKVIAEIDANEDKLDTIIGYDIPGRFDALDSAVAAVEAKLDDETRFTDDAELATHEAKVIAEIDANEDKLDSLEAKVDAGFDGHTLTEIIQAIVELQEDVDWLKAWAQSQLPCGP